MIVEALIEMRNRNNSYRSRAEDNAFDSTPFSAPSDVTEFGRSKGLSTISSSIASEFSQDSYSITSSPSSRSSKRHSNNLFGSGQFRDYRVMRQSTRSNTSKHSASKVPGEKIANSFSITASAVTEEDALPTASGSGSSAVNTSVDTDSGHVDDPIIEDDTESSNPALPVLEELRRQRGLSQAQAQRMSLSLEGILQDMEEEAGDRVLVPRSTPLRTLPEERGPAGDNEPKVRVVIVRQCKQPLTFRVLPG